MTTATLVKPGEIHSTLSRLWEVFERSGKMRASLFNLIFYTEAGTRAKYIQSIAKTIVDKFPARIIFIESDKKAPDNSLVTKVSILSGPGQKQEAACDLIEISAALSEKARVPFIVLPHILPDLPIYFLWGEEPSPNDPLFSELSKLATRLIFDSESASSLPKFAQVLLDLHHKKSSDVADLNWARTENWRDVLSSTFHKPEKLADLQDATEIRITFNKASTTAFCHTNIQAIYIQNWLSAQLNWKLKKVDKDLRFSYENLTVRLLPEPQPAHAPGMVLSIEIFCQKEKHYSFLLTGPSKISATFSTSELCEMPVQFLSARAEKGQSLVKEVCQKGTSSHFLKVLEQIRLLDEKLLC